MKITKRQLRKIIRESYMKDLYGQMQNHILAIGLDNGGELVVQDVLDYQSQTKAQFALSYDEILQIMRDMVEDGMLTDGYEDFFDVHPDYMQ